MARSRKSGTEISNDYYMLEKMGKELKKHEKMIVGIGKKLSKKPRSEVNYAILENLDLVATHMAKAYKEVEKAQKKIKQI